VIEHQITHFNEMNKENNCNTLDGLNTSAATLIFKKLADS